MSDKPTFTPPLTFSSMWGMIVIALVILIGLLLAAGVPADWRVTEGFFGTGASRMADLTVLAYAFILMPAMIAGGVLAVNKKFVPHHQLVMTFIVVLNWGLIAFTMYSSFDYVASGDNVPDEFAYQTLPFIHAGLGIVAQVLATLLVVRMWFEENLPDGMRFAVKTPMRLTLALWLITALLGLGTYVSWYDLGGSDSGDGDTAPLSTPESTEEPTDDTDAVPAPAATEDASTDSTGNEATPDPVTTEESSDDAGGEAPAPVATEDEQPSPATTEEGAEESSDDAESPEPVATEDAGG